MAASAYDDSGRDPGAPPADLLLAGEEAEEAEEGGNHKTNREEEVEEQNALQESEEKDEEGEDGAILYHEDREGHEGREGEEEEEEEGAILKITINTLLGGVFMVEVDGDTQVKASTPPPHKTNKQTTICLQHVACAWRTILATSLCEITLSVFVSVGDGLANALSYCLLCVVPPLAPSPVRPHSHATPHTRGRNR